MKVRRSVKKFSRISLLTSNFQGLAELQTKLANLILGLKAETDMPPTGDTGLVGVNGHPPTNSGWAPPPGSGTWGAASGAGYASPTGGGGWGSGGGSGGGWGTSPAQGAGGNTGAWTTSPTQNSGGASGGWGTSPAQPWGGGSSPNAGSASSGWGSSAQQGWGSPTQQASGWNL